MVHMGLMDHTPLTAPDTDVDRAPLSIVFDKATCSLFALKSAAYKLSSECAVSFSQKEDEILCLFDFKSGKDPANFEEFAIDFKNLALDEELRVEIADKTESMRNLILAFAFSKSGL